MGDSMLHWRQSGPALLVLALTLAACAPGRAASQTAPSAASPAAPAEAARPDRSAAPPAAVEPLPQKVTASYSSISGSFLPIFIATESGLFAKHGLDVDVTYIASGTTSMQSLLAG